jgi:hypothetical protein
VKELYYEIAALGYEEKKTVGYANLSKYIPKHGRIIYPKELPLCYWRPAQVSFLLYGKEDELNSKEVKLINYLQKEIVEVEMCYCMVQKLQKMIENKEGADLDRWIDDAMASSIKKLQSFTQGILNDFSAVQNTISLSWSNGQVEGQSINLKCLNGRCMEEQALNYYGSGWLATQTKLGVPPNLIKNHFAPEYAKK